MKIIKLAGRFFLFAILVFIMTVPASASAMELKYPVDVNGFPVVLIITSENNIAQPKGKVTLVLLDTNSKNVEDSSCKLDLNNYLKINPQFAYLDFEVYGGAGITKEEIIKNQTKNNERQKNTVSRG